MWEVESCSVSASPVYFLLFYSYIPTSVIPVEIGTETLIKFHTFNFFHPISHIFFHPFLLFVQRSFFFLFLPSFLYAFFILFSFLCISKKLRTIFLPFLYPVLAFSSILPLFVSHPFVCPSCCNSSPPPNSPLLWNELGKYSWPLPASISSLSPSTTFS